MNSSAQYRRASRRRGCRRNNRQRGGAGEAYTIGGPVTGQHVINNYDGEIQRFPSCEEAVRPGYLESAPIKGGLPGFAGGARKGRKGSRKSRRGSRKGSRKMRGGRGGVLETGAAQLATQMGGAYTFVPDLAGGVGMMDARYSGCGAGAYALQNPLNKGDITSLITAPPAQVPYPAPLPSLTGGRRTRRSTRRSQHGGVGGVDSMFYGAPRSGYTTWPSNAAGGDAGTLADGKTPFLINVPFSAQPTPSPNCLKTGGRRRRSSRKSRKASRKSRRASHKSRRSQRKGSRK
jgi:hypothetical protein